MVDAVQLWNKAKSVQKDLLEIPNQRRKVDVMRMWMIDPKLLCRKHLLGEHGEIHKFRHCFEKKYKMAGRMGQIEPVSMESRHDELAEEMKRRGYNHQSPYEQPDVSYLPEMLVNSDDAHKDLISRCSECYDIACGESSFPEK